ncbi:MAG: PspC domain-containing protein [Tissierellia bacterium]|nr:PspC domain-containing protein [Tissierellia bacterium]
MNNKRLYRSLYDRKIAGVCGGLGEFFGIDPTIIRFLWAISIFLYGTGIFAYIIAWVIIPEEPYY